MKFPERFPDHHWSVMMLYASYQEDGVDQWNERKFYSEEVADTFMQEIKSGKYPAVKQAHLFYVSGQHKRGWDAS